MHRRAKRWVWIRRLTVAATLLSALVVNRIVHRVEMDIQRYRELAERVWSCGGWIERRLDGSDWLRNSAAFPCKDWFVEAYVHKVFDVKLHDPDPEDVCVLANSIDIDRLILRDAGLVGDETLRVLTRQHGLTALEISGAKLTAASADCWRCFRNLDTLDLTESTLDDATLRAIAGLPELHRLCLVRTKTTPSGLRALSGCSKLSELDLDETSVDDAGVEAMVGRLPLERLSLAGTRISKSLAEHLDSSPELHTVNLTSTPGSPIAPGVDCSSWKKIGDKFYFVASGRFRVQNESVKTDPEQFLVFDGSRNRTIVMGFEDDVRRGPSTLWNPEIRQESILGEWLYSISLSESECPETLEFWYHATTGKRAICRFAVVKRTPR